jgi:hypothetical protein
MTWAAYCSGKGGVMPLRVCTSPRKEKADKMMHVGTLSRAMTATALVLLALQGASGQAVSSAAPRSAARAQVRLHFERNDGQAGSDFRYIARGQGYSLFLGADGASLALSNGRGANGAVVTMRPVGARSVRPTASDELSGKANYLIGRDRAAWLTDVPTYGRVTYRSVYPGIDLTYYGNHRRVQYDFVVAPNAVPGAIALAFDGAGRPSVDRNGDLLLSTAMGRLRHQKPYAYQVVNGRQSAVPARFAVRSNGTVGFELGRYDRSRTLIIDPIVYPILEWSTFLGGAGDDGAEAVAVDAAGNAYVASWTNSGNFPTKPGSYDTSINGNYDVAVTKISPDGTTLIYSTFIGGAGSDFASDIVLKGGNAIVVGDTDSANFPVTPGAVQGANAGGADGFVTELNAAGTALVASTYVGGSGYDTLRSVALVSGTNQVAVTGWTNSSNYPTTAGAFQTAWPAGLPSSAFATVVQPGLNAFLFSSYLHGNAQEQYGTGVAVDNLGRVAVVGRTNSATFPTTPGAFQTSVVGESDAFVTLFAAAGNSLVWSTLYGGLWTDGAEDVAIDAAGNVCFVGRADSNDLPMRGAYQGANMGGKDAFFAAIEPGGAMIHWGTYFGGAKDDEAYTLTLGNAGFMYITGETRSANFPVTAGAFQSARSGLGDAFVMKIKPTGGGVLLEYSTYLGGTGTEGSTGAACDGSNILYVSGWTTSANYPTTPGVLDTTFNGGDEDGFLARFNLVYLPTTHYTIDRSGIITEPVYLRAYDLKRTHDGAFLAGQTIDFKIEGTSVGTAVTNAHGDASLLWNITAGPASRTITTEFAGNDPYLPSTANATLTSSTMVPKLFGVDRTARITAYVVFKSWLWRTDNTGIPGRLLTFKLDGTPIGSDTTISSGRAQLGYTVVNGAGAGIRQIQTDWAGDAGYSAASCLNKLTVQQATPHIWVNPRSVPLGGTASLYALFRRLSDYQAQVGKSVDFKVDGTLVQTVVTKGSGVAQYSYVTVEPVGGHTIRCQFAGDAFVDAGYGEAALTIY